MRALLWTGPIFSLLLFATNIGKDALLSYLFMFNKLVRRRPVTFTENETGSDLSTTPIPARKQEIRQSMYDLRQCNQSLPLSNFAAAPPPYLVASPARAFPVPEHSTPDAAYISPMHSNAESGMGRQKVRNGPKEIRRAMREHGRTRNQRPLYPIPEVASGSAIGFQPSTSTGSSLPHQRGRIV